MVSAYTGGRLSSYSVGSRGSVAGEGHLGKSRLILDLASAEGAALPGLGV